MDVACHRVSAWNVPDHTGVDERGQQNLIARPERISRATVSDCVRVLGTFHVRVGHVARPRTGPPIVRSGAVARHGPPDGQPDGVVESRLSYGAKTVAPLEPRLAGVDLDAV